MLENATNEMICKVAKSEAMFITTFVFWATEGVRRLTVAQRYVIMKAAACQVPKRLRHEGRESPMLASDFVRHESEKHHTICSM
mmetsp:Transcript_40267/g.110806  ORF Transcript_40267/g.110806 Transcript_40267/m.110806 type:complete len:84 (+) Transcript_40267:909-1160(+)